MFVTSVKLWGTATLSLVVVMLLSGCPSIPLVEEQSVKTVETTVSPGIDTATYHVVERGETLYSIAQSYGRNHRDIAQWNNISVDGALSPGQRLRIDGPGAGYQPAGMSGVPVVTPRPSTPIPIPPEAQNADGTHIVRPGENLYVIAGQYGHHYKKIAAWNHIKPPYHLRVGQVLVVSPPPVRELTPISPVIPQSAKPQVVTPKPAPKPRVARDKDYHIVQPGDSLYAIAKHYGFSVDEIAWWNGFQQPYPPLSLGQKLRISAPEAGSVVPTPSPIPKTVSPTPKTVKPSIPQSSSRSHIVVPGDTLYSLARHYNHPVGDLAKWNNLQKPYSLPLGRELRVVPPNNKNKPGLVQEEANFQPVGLRPRFHIVKKGESLHGIARKYGLFLNDLAERNGIGSPYSVYPGLKLKIAPR